MISFAEFDDRTRANIFLKCFNESFTSEEGLETARQLDIMDYNDFLELLEESGAVHKTNSGKYWIHRKRL